MACSRRILMEELQRLVAFSGGVSSPPRGVFLGWTIVIPGRKIPGTLILIQATAGWQGLPGELRQAHSRCFAFVHVAQEGNVAGLLDHEEVFERVPLLLAKVIFFLRLRICRTLDRSFGPLVHKRGE